MVWFARNKVVDLLELEKGGKKLAGSNSDGTASYLVP